MSKIVAKNNFVIIEPAALSEADKRSFAAAAPILYTVVAIGPLVSDIKEGATVAVTELSAAFVVEKQYYAVEESKIVVEIQ